MSYLQDLNEIKCLYKEGVNLIEHLKDKDADQDDLSEAIMISYDIQSGIYTRNALQNPEVHDNYSSALAEVINKLSPFRSILEVGVGEASTFSKLLPKLHQQNYKAYGFDIAWSRVKYAQNNCHKSSLNDVVLFTGNMFHAPVQDKGADIVYTFHALEPNGGKEKEAITELLRITNKYLLLFEPIYELASDEGKARMDKYGFVKNLKATVESLHCKMLEYKLLDYTLNPLNPTGLILIEKEDRYEGEAKESPLACPVSRSPLIRSKDCYFCEESLLAYPIIEGVPCLLPQNAVVATHFLDDFNS